MANACYRSDDIHPKQRGNPFIEALRPTLKNKDAARLLGRRPDISVKEELLLPPHIRVHGAAAIADMYVPDRRTLELYTLVDVEKKRSLRRHMPFSAEGQLYLDSVQDKISEVVAENEERIARAVRKGSDPLAAIVSRLPDIRSIMVVGTSGMGKSTAVRRVLSMDDQVIEHDSYMGNPFRQKQLVWLSVFAPINASISGLCHSIFAAVDEALGLPANSGYAAQYDKKSRTNDVLIRKVAQVLATHYLGVLHIDDLQRISDGTGAHKAALLSFIMQLSDVVGVPIILSGTAKLTKIVSSSVEVGRRMCSAGLVEYEPIAEYSSDSNFANLMKALFKFSLLPIQQDAIDDLKIYLFDRSQGITAVAVTLFVQSQIWGLRDEAEMLTRELIDSAYAKIKPLHPALDALRRRDPNAMRMFDDLGSIDQILRDAIYGMKGP